MIRNFHWIRSTYAGSLLAIAATGCSFAEAPAGPQEAVGETQEQLAAYQFSTWTGWSMPINVCFTKFTTSDEDHLHEVPTSTQYSNLKTHAMSALQETWALVPGVSFVNQGNCSGSTPTYLHIEIKWGPYYGGACGAGVGASCALGGGLGDQNEIDFFKELLAHEVGHALGFGHEHQRTGTEFTSCEADRVTGCQNCKAAIDSSSACAAADWNACAAGNELLPAPVTTPQTFSTSSAEYALIQAMLANNGPQSTLELLTQYDPVSIMNYCSSLNGRAPYDYHPTALDLLGMEMTYPANVTYRIGCKSGCFVTSNGVITRTDASITTNWMMRGGRNVEMISPINGQDVTYVGTSGLTAGTSQLTFSFRAPRTGILLTTSGTLVNSNSAHAALIGVLL